MPLSICSQWQNGNLRSLLDSASNNFKRLKILTGKSLTAWCAPWKIQARKGKKWAPLEKSLCWTKQSHKVVVLRQFKSLCCSNSFTLQPYATLEWCVVPPTPLSLVLVLIRTTGEQISFLQQQETILFFVEFGVCRFHKLNQLTVGSDQSRCQLQQRRLHHSNDSNDLNSLNCQDSAVLRL